MCLDHHFFFQQVPILSPTRLWQRCIQWHMEAEAPTQSGAGKEQEQKKTQRGAVVSLGPGHIAAALVLFAASLGLTAIITSQAIGDQGKEAISNIQQSKAADLASLDAKLKESQKEVGLLSQRLRESYDKQRRLMVRSTELEAKVKAFQGTLSISKAPLLPSQDSVLPVSVSPVFTSGETPFIKDGSRWLVVRKEGLFNAVPAQADVKDAFAGKGIQIPSEAKKLSQSPRPAAGSASLLHPEREFTDQVKPVLKWKRQRGVIGGFVCVLLDREGKTVALSDPLEGDSWQPSNSLTRGQTYTWQLTLPNPADPGKGRVVAESSFYLLSEQESAEANRRLSAAGGSHLLRMAAYAEAGLFAGAEWEAQKFAEANPGLKDGQRLLKQMQGLRPKRD